jgi:hypothetical protein
LKKEGINIPAKLSFTDKVTTNMDLELKAAFQSLQFLHKKDFRAAVERGALEFIAEVDPEKALELEISLLEKQVMEKREALAQYRVIKNSNAQLKQVKKNEDPSLERMRLEKFEKWKESLVIQVSNGKIDWKTNMTLFMFDSIPETRDWILTKLQEAELLE